VQWLEEKAKAEANAKRSEATKAQHEVSNPRAGETYGAATNSGATKRSKNNTAKASASGTNRGAVEKGETLRKNRPDLAELANMHRQDTLKQNRSANLHGASAAAEQVNVSTRSIKTVLPPIVARPEHQYTSHLKLKHQDTPSR